MGRKIQTNRHGEMDEDMWYSAIGRSVSVGLVLLASTLAACASVCDVVPEEFAATGTAFRGTYANGAWGYSVVIPAHHAGYDPSDGPQHGFGIILGAHRRGYIFVNGEANSLEFEDPAAAAIQELKSLAEDKNEILSATIAPARLGGLKAVQLVVTYMCSGSEKRYQLASIFALSPRKGNVYEMRLDTTQSQYANYRPLLDAMIKSWKYTEAISGKSQLEKE